MSRAPLFVVPVVDPVRAERLDRSMAPGLRRHVCWVLNCHTYWRPRDDRALVVARRGNRGVAAAWNVGRGLVCGGEYGWLITCSEAIVFGDAGGRDLVDVLPEPSNTKVDDGWLGTQGFGWKLQAHNRCLLADVGEFDENFWPAYFEDTDYLYRMGLRGWPSPRENGRACTWVEVDANLDGDGDAHAIRLLGIDVDLERLDDYYRRKWGGPQGEETFTTPFGLPDVDDRWWPAPGQPWIEAAQR